MGIILGVDIGTSATKIAGLHRTDGRLLAMYRVQAEDPVTSLYGAVGRYLSGGGLGLQDVDRVVLTGIGASHVTAPVFDLPTCHADEFETSGLGALSLSGEVRSVVVTMGTGTAFLFAERGKPVRHLCGSGMGGGTLAGLCRAMTGTAKFAEIQKLALQGDSHRVDLSIKDLTGLSAATLSPDMTASNFGKLSEEASPADMAAGVVNLVLQVIGTMTVLACQSCQVNTVVLIGSMTALQQVPTNFQQFEDIYGIRYRIPEHAAYATAIGAALRYAETDTVSYGNC